MIKSQDGERGTFVYEVTVYVEHGWWLVHAVDIGRQTSVGTLDEVEDAARQMYANHFSCPAEEISIELTVYRSRANTVVRTAWRRLGRRLAS